MSQTTPQLQQTPLECPLMAARKKTSDLRPTNLSRDGPHSTSLRPSTDCKKLTPSKPSSQTPAVHQSFAAIAASAAHLPDPGAKEKKINLISRPLKEKKKKPESNDCYIDPQDEWYASSEDDECYVTDDENYPLSDNEMWQ